ncbi:MAG: class I SAM-dependent methyltransferase [Armatimonadetes bacterium]|nr:class I SAM-dependent methyltransferase [Armatimonadota bacterium]
MRQSPAWRSYERRAAAGQLDGISGSLVDESGRLALSSDGEKEAEFFRSALAGRERVLDLGCGNGFPLLVLAERVPWIVGLDASPTMLALARKNAALLGLGNVWIVRGVVERLPFAARSFDGMAIGGTLESIADPGPALTELARVATSGAVVASLEQDFRARLAQEDEREQRWFRQDRDGVYLHVRLLLTEPYRVRHDRYLLDPTSEIVRNARRALEHAREGRVRADIAPGELPAGVIHDASREVEAQYDPATLCSAFEAAGFQAVEQEVRESYGVPHIFSVFRRR